MPFATITFASTGRSPRARIVLADGEILTTTSRAVLKVIGIEEGDTAPVDVLLDQISRTEPTAARERALKILDYRERSVAELQRGLADDGYSQQCIEVIIDRFTELGLVSDERFSELFVRTKRAAGWGDRRTADGLRRAGIDDAAVVAALGESPDDAEFERAFAIAVRKRPTDPAACKRVTDALIRRGYGFDTARRAAFQACELARTSQVD